MLSAFLGESLLFALPRLPTLLGSRLRCCGWQVGEKGPSQFVADVSTGNAVRELNCAGMHAKAAQQPRQAVRS